MSLTSLSFLGLYLPLLLIIYFNPVIKSNAFRKFVLLMAGLGLYTLCEPIYILLLVGMIVLNYFLVWLSDKTATKVFRAFAVIFDAGVLLLFKYINSVLSLGLINKDISPILFPIGLSFFTFKLISYVADSKEVKEGNIIDVAIYTSNFLTIVCGPLSTYSDELPAIREKKPVSFECSYKGLERFMRGFAKKVIIADRLSQLVAQCFSASEMSVLMAWACAVAYSLQLFFDFSGYTDMAIGLGYLFGFDLPENFNYPYLANSVSDFWKRWHMSLTKWFTKYIYIPLGGSRVKTVFRHIFNLFVVWLVTGIWHGSHVTFIIWAMIYFVLQLLEKYTKWADILNKCHLGHIYTLLVVLFEWVIFRSDNLSSCLSYFGTMFGIKGTGFALSSDIDILRHYLIPFILGIVFSTGVGKKFREFAKSKTALNIIYNTGLIVLFVVCLIITIGQGYSAPLYAGF